MEIQTSVTRAKRNLPIYAAGTGYTAQELRQHTAEVLEMERARVRLAVEAALLSHPELREMVLVAIQA